MDAVERVVFGLALWVLIFGVLYALNFARGVVALLP